MDQYSDRTTPFGRLPASPDRQPIRGADHLQQVVIIHELDQGTNWELVEQLVRRGVPNRSADRLCGSIDVMWKRVYENVDAPTGSHLKTAPNSLPFAGTPRWSRRDPGEVRSTGSNP